jgi:hypothetical protein
MLGRLNLSASSEATSCIYNLLIILMAVLRRYIAVVTKTLIRPAESSITRQTEPW